MKKIAIIFGPLKGSTHKVAQLVAQEIGLDNVDMIPVKDANQNSLDLYNNIIFGVSTVGKHNWDSEHIGGNWDRYMPILENIDLSGKTIAIFGLGDHIAYALHFVDNIGLLADLVEKRGAKVIGKVPASEYVFEDSQALRDGMFLGLPIDEDYEAEKTPDRVKRWVADILKEMK